MPAERLQKIIAAAGIASRRKAEELIIGGLVSVNGQTVTALGTKADPEHDRIKVNGKVLAGPERHVYLLLHKPKGYVTTVTDPEGRPKVLDLVRAVPARVYPVGRLDYLSEGLLLLTNDGDLAQKLTHASSHVPKTYLVKISGKPAAEQIERLRRGVTLRPERAPLKTPAEKLLGQQRRRSEAVRTAPARIQLLREAANPWYEVTLVEGRNRQIRRMFEEIGHHVEKIKRVRYGPLALDVEPGKFRHLTVREVEQLKSATSRTQKKSQRSI
jgi:23S rRNA pseudouridine2605 synthase